MEQKPPHLKNKEGVLKLIVESVCAAVFLVLFVGTAFGIFHVFHDFRDFLNKLPMTILVIAVLSLLFVASSLTLPPEGTTAALRATPQSNLNVLLEHRLTQEEALKKVRCLLTDLRREHADKITDVHENWEGNVGRFTLRVAGHKISGTLTVGPDFVEVDGNLPFLASLVSDRIESLIREQAAQRLGLA